MVQCFVVGSDEVKGRIDPMFYSFELRNEVSFTKKTRYALKKLGEIAILSRGKFTYRPRNEPRFYGGIYPFLQTGDIVRASSNNDKIKYRQTLNEEGLKVSKLFQPNLILITIAANIGDTAILDYPACFPDSVVAIKPQGGVDISYLNYFLKRTKAYLNLLAPQAAQKNINLKQLSPTPIIVPPLSVQKKIVDLMDAAYRTKREKETEAQELLDGIDGYVLGELGIKKSIAKKEMFFSVSSKEVRKRGVLSALYYFSEVDTNFKNATTLSEVADISPKTKSPQDNDGLYPYIGLPECSDTEIRRVLERPKKEVKGRKICKEGDILFARIEPSIFNKKYIFVDSLGDYENAYISTEFYVIRAKTKLCLPRYLYCLLFISNIFDQFAGKTTGSTGRRRLDLKILKNIKIPLPDLLVQKRIATEVRTRMNRAKQLRAEALQEVEEAKEEVEKILLN